jgi:DNA-binding transcriptional ArsR family regulator
MDAFQALADPTRRSIVAMLAAGERSAGDIGAEFAITAPAVSQHLKVLREARLVHVRADAQRRIYRLDPDGIAEVRAWLDGVSRFWNPRLDALEAMFRQPDPE